MINVKTEYYHNDLTCWNKTLQFYTDILRIFEMRLAEVADKNTNTDVLASVEHFQNQFILQREQFELLRHDINEQEKLIRVKINSNKHGAGDPPAGMQEQLKEKMQLAENIFTDTKRSFYRFLSIVL